LINKKYYIFNEECSKEEYLKRLAELEKLPLSKQKEKFNSFYKDKYIKNPLPNTGSENVIDSENIINSKNIYHCNNLVECENSRYSSNIQD
jgi:hypothetical protein